MVTLKTRGQIINQTDTVQLTIQFRDFIGAPTDLLSFPQVSIIQPSGNVVLGPTGVGVYRLNVGLYGFDFPIGVNGNLGVYTDVWQGVFDGYSIGGTFNFVVMNTQMPMINSDGYEALGDDPGFNYDQTAIHNINKLLKTLRARLNSSGKHPGVDSFGNPTFTDCDIFSVDSLVTFLASSLTLFNEIPMFTFFTFDDTTIIDQFHDAIVQGAVLMALSSIALMERGKEFAVTDNGVSFAPPGMSELLNTQWNAELTNHTEKIKAIKANMKPSPSGLGTLTMSSGRNPAVARLRLLRARQIF